jgi:hypothetical protein
MKPGHWRVKLTNRRSLRLWAVALFAAPAAALLCWFGLGALANVAFSSMSTVGTIVAVGVTVLALAVAPALTWRAAIKGGGERSAGPMVASAAVAMALFGGALLALVLETSRALHQTA